MLLSLCTALLAVAAWRLAGALAPRRPCELLLLATLLLPALVVLLLLGLGLSGRLTPSLALTGSAAAAVLSLGIDRAPRAQSRRRFNLGRALASQGAAAGAALCALAVVALALVAHAALALPPGGWDEWWYHLPPMARAVQTQRLSPAPIPLEWVDPRVAQVHGGESLAYRLSVTGFWGDVYPQVAELLALWTMLLRHDDLLVGLSQFYCAGLGALAVYALARRLGAVPGLSTVAGALWLITPVTLGQAPAVVADLAFASFTLAALAAATAWTRDREAGNLLAWAVAAGLALGSKPTGVALAALWIAVAAWQARRLGPAPVLALASGCLLLGGFWYLRNWWTWGNPVYPVSVGGLGHRLFPGLGHVQDLFVAANTPRPYLALPGWRRLLSSWWEVGDEPVSFFTRTGGFGAAWLAALPVLGLGAPLLGRRALAPLALLAIILLITPAPWWARYTLTVPGIGFAVVAATLRRLPPAPRQACLAALLAAGAFSLVPAVTDLTTYATVARTLPPGQRTIGRLYHADYAWVDAVPSGAIIAHGPMTITYPLYGRQLQHGVVQVDAAEPAAWQQALVATGATWVCTLDNYGPHFAWANAWTGLEPAGRHGHLAVFRLRQGA